MPPALSLLLFLFSARADQNIPLLSPTRAALPDKATLLVEGGAIFVERHGERAAFPLPEDRPGYRSPVERLSEITATDNRAWITVRWTDVCGFEDQAQARLAALFARTENALGRRLAEGRIFEEALPRLARAVQSDPEFLGAALDLARAQLAAGLEPEALETLEPWIAREPAKVYLECLQDQGLAPLLSTPRVAGLAAAPGSARLEAKLVLAASQEFSAGRLVAYEPRRRLIAAVERVIAGGGEDGSACPWRSALHIIEAKGGRRLAKFKLVEAEETATNQSCLKPSPVPPAAAKAVEERLASANRALSALGFSLPTQKKAVSAPAPGASPEDPSVHYTELLFPADGLSLRAYSDGHAELRRGELALDRAAFVERANWAVYLPEARLVVYQWGQFPSAGCPRNVYGGIGALRP